MNFDWVIPVIIALMLYACVYYWLKSKKILPHLFGFSGPFILIKTEHVGLFDKFAKFKRFLKIYATTGIILTILSGIAVTILFVATAILTFLVKPEPTAVENLLLIPGINQYVPSTVAVWISLILAMFIHEFGHGILCRAEGIKVKSTGLLALVIPFGAFVEPDEEDIEKASLGNKLRMFAAGITNNIVVGVICLIILVVLLGLLVPVGHPYISGVAVGFPAEQAGVLPGTILLSINDVPISSTEDIATALSGMKAGDVIKLNGEYKGEAQSYDITLSAIPEGVTTPSKDGGYMGVYYSTPQAMADSLNAMIHPTSFKGLLYSLVSFVALPFSAITGNNEFGFIVSGTPEYGLFTEPFWGYWGLVHFFFWSAWINILLGVFNAVPIRSFDGGQMLREALRALYRKRGWNEDGVYRICSFVSVLLLMTLILCILLPYLFAV